MKLQAYYYETEDYTGVLITDGTNAVEIGPMGTTEEEAKKMAFDGVIGSEDLDEVTRSIGVDKEKFRFYPKEFSRLVLITDI